MRDYEYIALGLYMNHLNERNGQYSRTGVLSEIMIGELPPIPSEYINQAKIIAKEESIKKQMKTKKEEDKAPIGGGIFTF